MKLPFVAIVGRPNIGKSTLFNRVIGHNKSVTFDAPGTTRDRVSEVVDWYGQSFLLIDTGGIEVSAVEGEIEIGMQEQVRLAIEEADCVLLGLDGQAQFFTEDRKILEYLYQSKKPFYVFFNKVDNESIEWNIQQEYGNMAFDYHCISAKTGRGLDDLFDEIASWAKSFVPKNEYLLDKTEGKIALIGKPNVGKSSLMNVFLNNEQMLVSEIAGTTRDSVDFPIQFHQKTYTLIDTAGLRRKSRVDDTIEEYSVMRTLRAMESADVIILVIDITDGVVKQDMTIADQALQLNKSIILVANKWDLVDKEVTPTEKAEAYLRKEFAFLKWVPIIFCSAHEKQRTYKILETVAKTIEARKQTVSTSKFNLVLQQSILKKPPQARNSKYKHPKIYYATQTGVNPPEFTLFVNNEISFHSSYMRYLESVLREEFQFFATPIKLVLKNRR